MRKKQISLEKKKKEQETTTTENGSQSSINHCILRGLVTEHWFIGHTEPQLIQIRSQLAAAAQALLQNKQYPGAAHHANPQVSSSGNPGAKVSNTLNGNRKTWPWSCFTGIMSLRNQCKETQNKFQFKYGSLKPEGGMRDHRKTLHTIWLNTDENEAVSQASCHLWASIRKLKIKLKPESGMQDHRKTLHMQMKIKLFRSHHITSIRILKIKINWNTAA